jgi:cytochrome c oxidase subunit II
MRFWKAVILAVFLAGGLILPLAAQDAPGEYHEIKMTAKKYEFNPNVITVKKGEKVRLIVTAIDRDHGLEIEGYGINQRLKKGQPAMIDFTADKAGEFVFKCSVPCGLGHGRMKGKLIVQE